VALVLAAVPACSVDIPAIKTDERVQKSEDFAVTSEQVRIRARSLVEPLTAIVRDAADQILTSTQDPGVRRAALLWKLEAVPTLRAALFRPNPLLAVFEAWVFAWQMLDAFESGPMKSVFGAAQPIAVQACQRLEAEMESVFTSLTISKDVKGARAAAQKWAGDHPIRGTVAGRETIASSRTKLDVDTSLSATEVLGNLTISIDDLNRRLETLTAQILDEARWQAELFALDFAREHDLAETLQLAGTAAGSAASAAAAVDRLTPEIGRAVKVVESAPALVAHEREAALRELTAELTRFREFIHEERVAALKQLSTEREAAIADVRDTVVAEHRSLTADLEPLAVRVAEHAVDRLAFYLALGLAGAFAGASLLTWLARRRSA
jgi:hypothetical protein